MPLEKRSCFDIAARKNNQLVLIKILSNIDSLHEDQSTELRALAYRMNGSALLIGEHSKAYSLQEGVIYERYHLQALTLRTLEMVVSGQAMPKKKYYKGRMVAELDQTLLEKSLEQTNITELARKMNVSRRALYQYKEGSRIEFKRALELEELLETQLIKPQQIFSSPEIPPKPILHGYLKKMQSIGFQVTPVHRGFDALASERESLIIDETTEPHAKHKAAFMKDLGNFFDSRPVFVIDKPKHNELKGVPVLGKKEIKKSEAASELIEKAKKRER
ncbi:hypothetical protein K8R43_02785 [archaeon]|nr:hypothetical protein [archaeon]